jgi:hypothetical protein
VRASLLSCQLRRWSRRHRALLPWLVRLARLALELLL